MRSSAVWWALALVGVAGGAALAACATGADTIPTPIRGSGSSSSSGSSGGTDDATVSTSSGGSGSSGGYGDDSTNPTPPNPDTGTPGDDGGGNVPGPTCLAGQACVDGIPSGWSGFVQILLQAGDAGAGCAAPYATPQPQLGGQTNPDGGPATCGACSCALPEAGITCSVNAFYDDLLCFGGANAPVTAVPSGACTTIGGGGGNGGVSLPKWTAGACVPQAGGVTTPPPPPSSATAVACAPADGGAGEGGTGATCASGQACAAVPPGVDGGTPSGVCVYQAGVQTCPPPGTTLFTNTYVVGALEDGRGCGCSCADPQCPADGYLTGYSNAGCTTTVGTYDAGSACKNGGTKPSHAIYNLSRSGSKGTCAVADGGPTGSVTIDGGSATTFCCVP
jgi:hypothetical protein